MADKKDTQFPRIIHNKKENQFLSHVIDNDKEDLIPKIMQLQDAERKLREADPKYQQSEACWAEMYAAMRKFPTDMPEAEQRKVIDAILAKDPILQEKIKNRQRLARQARKVYAHKVATLTTKIEHAQQLCDKLAALEKDTTAAQELLTKLELCKALARRNLDELGEETDHVQLNSAPDVQTHMLAEKLAATFTSADGELHTLAHAIAANTDKRFDTDDEDDE
jgi:hypothetical protein